MFLKHLRALGLLAAMSATAAFAAYDVDILPPGSPTAQDAYALLWVGMYCCIAFFFIVFGAMLWSIF